MYLHENIMISLYYSRLIAGLIVCIIFLFVIKHTTHHNCYDTFAILIQQLHIWNQSIATKQAAIDFYMFIDQMCVDLINQHIHLNITKQEFDNMTLQGIKQLNQQAIDHLYVCLKNSIT